MKLIRNLILAWLTNCATAGALAQNYYVTTLSGAFSTGSTDGTSTQARFYHPWAISVDEAGTVFVADTYNNTVRKITQAGLVTTLAGLAGSPGSADGAGAVARFNFPQGIAVDRVGVIYVADGANATIRKVTPEGVVTTLAGMPGISGDLDGTGSEARFYSPYGLAQDGEGNLIVGDQGNRLVRRVTTSGVVTTLTARAPNEPFRSVRGLTVDSAGNIYVADGTDHVIRQVRHDGSVSILAGTRFTPGYRDGVGGAVLFDPPESVAADRFGNLIIADAGNRLIRKVTPSGVVTTIAGTPGTIGYLDGPGNAARFMGMQGVAVDKWGNIYVADTYSHTIRKLTPILPLQVASAGGRLSLTWPSWAVDYILQARPALGDTNAWTTITNGITTDTNNFSYTFSPTNSAAYFRVRSP